LDAGKIGHGHFVALIRFFYKLNPADLNADLYAQLTRELEFLGEVGVIDIKINLNAGN
jgi:hypothetical protein